jgi:two-component system, OmpR family, sensor histidine kinase BaeS
MIKPVTFRIGRLGLQLAIAFLGFALTAIIVVSILTEIGADRDVKALVTQQENALSRAVAVASGALYGRAGWRQARLQSVLALCHQEGAAVEVRDTDGDVVKETPGYGGFRASNDFVTLVAMHGRPVGWVRIKYGDRGLGSVVKAYDSDRLSASLGAAGIVALVALVVSLLISWRIAMPAERVLATIRARGAGDRSARVSQVRGTGVVAELAATFDETSDAIDKRDRLHKNLVANIAHELRTPVAILQASHEAMIDGLTSPTRENLWSLRDEVLRLARMIEDLQRLAAAEAAALQLTLVPQDLSRIAAEAAASLSNSFAAAEVALVTRLVSAGILCDPDRMREVITNLLTNALKFTPAGGSVVLAAGPAGRGLARLTVTDTGIGIPSDELPRVTERFFRGQRSSEMAAGSGIGLTIVAELVSAQNGDLDISSEPGKGTQATITIPSSEPRERRARRHRSGRPGPAGPSGSAYPGPPHRPSTSSPGGSAPTASLVRQDRIAEAQSHGPAA